MSTAQEANEAVEHARNVRKEARKCRSDLNKLIDQQTESIRLCKYYDRRIRFLWKENISSWHIRSCEIELNKHRKTTEKLKKQIAEKEIKMNKLFTYAKALRIEATEARKNAGLTYCDPKCVVDVSKGL